MARDLRKRVTLAIIIPLFLGMIIITAVTCIPLYIEYSNYIENYDQHMINYEKHVMMELNKVVAGRQSVGVFQLAANFAQLSSNLITNFYYGRIEQAYSWNNLTIIENYENSPVSSDSRGVGVSNSTEFDKDLQFKNTSIFYYFMQPIVKIGEKFKFSLKSAHITYANYFFTLFPCDMYLFNELVENFLPPDTGFKNFTQSSFWNLTQKYQKLTFVPGPDPMVCKPLLIHKVYIGTLVCVVYDSRSINSAKVDYADKVKLYIVDENYLIYFPTDKIGKNYCQEKFGFDCSECSKNKTSQSLSQIKESSLHPERFLKLDPSDDICHIPKAINSHTSHINTDIDYSLHGKDRVSAVSPVNISLPILQDSIRTFSTVLDTEKTQMSRKFDQLSKTLKYTIYIQIIVFTVVLIGIILIVFLISYKITSSVISPIDDLYTILKKLHTDLGVNVKSHIKKGPPEVTDLYEVFDRLRLILRFEDAKLFKDPTDALMNFAQALRLFHSFNNKRAMEKCFQEIGNIHMGFNRYVEAAMNYHCSLLISQELLLDDHEIASRQVKTAIAMLKAKTKPERAKNLFYQALNHFSSEPIQKKLPIYLDLIECLLLNQDQVTSEMARAEEYLSALAYDTENILYLQRFRYLQALNAFNKTKYRLAAELCTEALEGFPVVDRDIRRKALALIKKIFKKFKISTEQIEVLTEAMKEAPKDVVVVFEKRLADGLDEGTFTLVTESLFVKHDRISFVEFEENCQVICNLTTSPRRKCSMISSLLDFKKTVLNDAVYLALVQLNSINSIIPQSFLSKEVSKKQWIVVVTCGEDSGSVVNEEKLIKKLYQSNANLVVVLVTNSEEVSLKMETIVKVTPFGMVINCPDFLNIQEHLLKAAAFISQTDSLHV